MGALELAKRAAKEGLEVDPSNKTLESELVTIQNLIKTSASHINSPTLSTKVQIADSFPSEMLTASELQAQAAKSVPETTNDTPMTSAPSLTPLSTEKMVAPSLPFSPPNLPLTMLGLTQLLRTPLANKPDAYLFFFENVSPSSIPDLLGKAGVESEFIEFVLDSICSVVSTDAGSEKRQKALEFLEIIPQCPRFSIAWMFTPRSKLEKASSLLAQSPGASNVLNKWS